MQEYVLPFIRLLNEMAPYLLLGFLIAGILHAFVPQRVYAKYLAGSDMRSVVLAALFGVPLPLCSCGVIPTAMSMRREGASKGAVVSFLIATPQTGVDSIAATASLLGLPFALLRPVAAFVTALFGGALTGAFTRRDPLPSDAAIATVPVRRTFRQKCRAALRYGFVEMMQDIGSIVEWVDPAAKTTTWYFYADKDITAPSADKTEGMRITVAEGVATAEVDLSTADAEKLAIVCGDFTNAAGTTGTLNLVKNEEGTLTLAIDAVNGTNRLRAAYSGTFATGYKSANNFSVSGIETPAQADLKRIFLFKDTSRSNYAFGLADAEAPAALMDGKYALRLGIGNAVFGRTIDLATQASMCELEVYEYDTYTTFDINKIEGVTGTVISGGTVERPYLYVKAVFPEGPTVEGEWFGDAAAQTEAFDIVPVKPFVPYIKIFSKDGDVIFEKTLDRMEMRMEKDYKLRGGPQYGGALFDAYFFYFRPVEDTGDIDDLYGDYSYPILMMAKPYIGSTDLNLADPKEDLHWNFKYTANDNKLQYGSSGYSETYSTGYSTSGYCPDEVKTTIVQNEDKTWTVTIQLKDAGSSLNYAGQPQPWGYGNSIVIEWKGAATKYTGTKKNDLTDADY